MKNLETDRLVLRGFNIYDLEDLYEYSSSDKVGPNAGWDPHKSLDESKKWLELFMEKQENWAIYHKRDHKVIGSIGVHENEIKAKDRTRELGFVLAEEYWGQEIIVEGCRAIMDYVFRYLDVERLSVSHFTFNFQSKRVIEKLGFNTYDVVKLHRISTEKFEYLHRYLISKEEYDVKTIYGFKNQEINFKEGQRV